jgi:hypothetical protein
VSRPKPSEDERTTWALLALATARMYAQNCQSSTKSVLSPEESDRIGLLMAIEGNARMRLVKQFGLNLDTHFDRAEQLYEEVRVEEQAKIDADNKMSADVKRLLKDIP